MPRINVLSKEISELIAAGEVVERPASAIKEMIENSLDAGAQHITVEIERGGITFIRITDDGCGIIRDDVKKAFLRHATSKIKTRNDLDGIKTLGFRGEALASVAAVAKVEMFTHSAEEEYGSHYIIEGGGEVLLEDSGCPLGTTVIVRDIFYNTPARMKFLKKDSTEGATVSAVVQRAALSNPGISFKFIREGKQIFLSPAGGDLKSAIYSVLGREFSKNLLEVNSQGSISVSGFCSAPFACRASRNGQYIYLNRRFVKSTTVMAAAEQAYKNSVMTGKFPAFVLFVDMPYEAVDVNVHPAKTEVRFADEKAVFSAVYAAVKSALMQSDKRPELSLDKKTNDVFFDRMDTKSFKQLSADIDSGKEGQISLAQGISRLKEDNLPFFLTKEFAKQIRTDENRFEHKSGYAKKEFTENDAFKVQKSESDENAPKPVEENPITDGIILIGEAFKTYIIIQKGESIFILDKHACHERIIFNRLKSETGIESQSLLSPVTIHLSAEQYSAVTGNLDELLRSGIELEDFGNETVIVRAVPAALAKEDIEDIVVTAAQQLISGGHTVSLIDDILHMVACKAATKAGYVSSDAELLSLAKQVFSEKDVLYCPHGRPVAFELKRSELEKRFGRIQ
ncbi:MAG: DNA mismatch repair endonuclease MutL [Clostridia bacterium]|nr:DNA mismatch repair endonuclease MutL [Clostridia bacterium]